MLEVIIIVLILFWALGVFVVPVGGGSLIHLLLVVAVLVIVVRVLRGERL